MRHANSGIELTSITRDSVSGEYRVRYDPETTPASLAVVAAEAAASKVETTDLEPLYQTVDSEALDALTTGHTGRTTGLRISFDYEGHTVTVDSRGRVRIGEQEPGAIEDDHKAVSEG